MSEGSKLLSEKYGIKFYIKNDEDLEIKFEANYSNSSIIVVWRSSRVDLRKLGERDS